MFSLKSIQKAIKRQNQSSVADFGTKAKFLKMRGNDATSRSYANPSNSNGTSTKSLCSLAVSVFGLTNLIKLPTVVLTSNSC